MKTINKLFLVISFSLFASLAGAQEIKKWKIADLKAAITKAEKPTIFNFWASFCKPCLEEIPYFQEMVKAYEKEGVELILVNLDNAEWFPNKLKALADKRKITSQIAFLDETDADLFCPAVDSSWSGAIPASLFINNKTGYRKFFEDQLKKEVLEKEILLMIKEKS
jgi:thiol-disulfide isomerase/thioredoxin